MTSVWYQHVVTVTNLRVFNKTEKAKNNRPLMIDCHWTTRTHNQFQRKTMSHNLWHSSISYYYLPKLFKIFIFKKSQGSPFHLQTQVPKKSSLVNKQQKSWGLTKFIFTLRSCCLLKEIPRKAIFFTPDCNQMQG